MKISIVILLLFFFSEANATTYYVSSSGNNNNNGISAATAWQTLSKVQDEANSKIFKEGDSILFKKGDTFTGTLRWATIWGQDCATGTSAKPITFSNYGNGSNPKFLYPPGGNTRPEDRILMHFAGVDYIVIDGLDFTDSDTNNDKITPANCAVPIFLGALGEAATNFCTIKNVNISLCGMGVVIVGSFNKVTHSKLTNFKNVKSTPNTGGNTAYEDYGANAITITGSDNEISYNYISGAWAESQDFGWNGGACEMYNNCNRNKLTHNTIYDCGGVSEFGAQQADAAAEDNVFSFNRIIDCGALSYCNISGHFAMQVSNVQYFNNTIIEDSNSRFSGPNTGRGISSAGPRALIRPDAELFAYNGNPDATIVFNLKNNIFKLSTGIAIARKGNDPQKYEHENNVYQLLAGSVTNYKLNNSELLTTKPVIENTSLPDPSKWDYHPSANTKGKIVGADAKPLPAYAEAVIAMIIIDDMIKFTTGRPVTLFDLSYDNISRKTVCLYDIVRIFLSDVELSAWFNPVT